MYLGVYFNQRNFTRLYKGKLGYKMNYLAEEALKEGVQLFVFSPLSIEWLSKKVNCLAYDNINKNWNLSTSPFPDVIYDRATFNKKEKEVGRFVRQRFQKELKIPFINNKSYFNKWETHELLSKDAFIVNYLPQTENYCHPSQIVHLLDKYTSVYIKDSKGKLGRNIFRISKLSDDLYKISSQSSVYKYSDTLNLQEVQNKIINDLHSDKTLIIQQGIEVATLNNHPFDVRLLAQKKSFEDWEVVDKSLRVAAPGSVVTNVSSGGEVKKFKEVIPVVFSNPEVISNEVDMLSIRICEALEKEYGNLAELGIDIAIDSTGKVWLLEVNGKPAKLCIYRSGNLELISRSCHNIVRYSKELFNLRNKK
jgi:glutathione synthase/RimK-type ligase-like ATP-grasp enzyme